MITFIGLFILFALFWLIVISHKSIFNVILSWILALILKKTLPDENANITVEDFGFFCLRGVKVYVSADFVVKIDEIVLEFLWHELRLQLQSTAKGITFESVNLKIVPNDEGKSVKDDAIIKACVSLGINLYYFDPPTELLNVGREKDFDNKFTDKTSLWFFLKNLSITVHGNIDDDDALFEFSTLRGDALIQYNSNVAKVVLFFHDASANFSSTVNGNADFINAQRVGRSEGLILVYKFEHGKLKSSHCRLKHTEISITPVALGCFKNLMTRYIDECLRNSVARKKNQEKDYEVNEEDVELKEKFEVTNEAESFSVKIFSPDCSKHFELTLAFIGVGSPYDKTIQWSISVPFELTFVDVLVGREKEYAIGSKIKSDGLINPCVLKIEGEEISKKTSNWNGRFNEGILVEIKPKYVHTIENFIETYELYCNRRNSWEFSDDDSNSFLDSSSTETSFDQDEIDTDRTQTAKKNAYDITASICEITIELKNAFDRDLLQVVIIYPEFSISQNEKTRSIDFKIEDLKGYNCFENIPFFHPTRETEEKPSLAISILEKISTSADKLSFEKFSFGSCDTTVLVGETLLLAVLKDFGLHKKIPKVFLGSGEDRKKSVSRASTKRFHFDHFELRDVEVILTLLPATDLPVDLKIIKNNLGIPHQLPPKIENACLQFDAFIRKDIQYGSYKYISYDIKNHYLKEFGSQSARVLGSMHLLGNISRLKQDIMSGFKTLRETGEFVTFFRQVTTGVASSYSKLAGSWSGLFGFNSSTQNAKESHIGNERRHSDPSDLDVAMIRQLSENDVFVSPTSKDDSEVLNVDDDYLWMNSSILPGINNEPDGMNWDTESSDGEATLGIPLELIPKNVKRQIKGQEFLRRLKENIGDNEHGEVFSCCLKVRKTDAENKLNALLSNRKVYFLKGRPCHESLVLCVKYETLYKAQYIFKDKTHYVQLVSKMKGIKTLSIPSRNPGESPLVRCDDVLAARKISSKINELKRDYDHEYMHIQHQ